MTSKQPARREQVRSEQRWKTAGSIPKYGEDLGQLLQDAAYCEEEDRKNA